MTERIRERVDRQLSHIMSLGGLVLTCTLALGAAPTIWYFDWRWLLVCGAVTMLIAIGAFAGHVLPMRVLRVGWVLVPALTSVALITTYVAYRGPDPEQLLSWQAVASPAAMPYLVLWLRRRWAVIWSIVMMMLPAVSSLLVIGPVATEGVVNMLSMLSGVGMMLLFIAIRDSLFQFRQSEAAAEDQELRRAHAAAQSRKEAEFARIVHDEVLASLSAAMHLHGPTPRVVRQEAEHALSVLAVGPQGRATASSQWNCAEFAERLRAVASRIDAQCRVETEVSGFGLPRVVAEDMLAATAEALRNSVRHAGSSASRTILAVVSDDAVRIEVRDDGVGFEIAQIDQRRLGVRESILGRVRAHEHGFAAIDSSPGRGTRVVLQWHS